MTKVVREPGEVAPEVEAARQRLKHHLEGLLEVVGETGYSPQVYKDLLKLHAGDVQAWYEALQSEYICAAFWAEVVRELNSWHGCAVIDLKNRNILEAVKSVRWALRELIEYAKLLGVEIPPEGEEVAEPVVEEPAGTPLRVLDLSMRVHGCLARGLKGELGRWPLVEDIVRILSEKGEKGLRAIRGVGPKALEEILAALKAKSFIMEPWEK